MCIRDRAPGLQRALGLLIDLLMALVCLFVAGYGARLCYETMGQSIAELPWMPVGVTYLPIPLGAALTLLFVLERIAFGSQATRPAVKPQEPR